MKDMPLLSDLEVKIRELIGSLEREREKNIKSEKLFHESQKIPIIEEKVKNLINLIDQMENI